VLGVPCLAWMGSGRRLDERFGAATVAGAPADSGFSQAVRPGPPAPARGWCGLRGGERSDCFDSVNAAVLFDEGFYLEGGAQFISQTGPQADLGEQGPERGGRPPEEGR